MSTINDLKSLRDLKKAVDEAEEPLTMFGTSSRTITLDTNQLRKLKSILRTLINQVKERK